MKYTTLSLLTLALLAPAGAAQELIHDLFLGGAAGSSVAGVGDIDGDGKDDVAVGDAHNGGVRVLSGADATVMLSLPTPAVGSSFGNLPSYVIDRAGDIDGDGTPDVMVARVGDAVPGPAGFIPTGPGSLTIHSGANGAVLWSANGSGAGLGQSFGYAAANVGDVNGDGKDDFAVGAPLDATGSLAENGYVEVLSGAGGQSLMLLPGAVSGDRFGQSVAAVGDHDTDGKPDFIVASVASGGLGEIRSGANGAVLATYSVGAPVTPPAFGMGFPYVTVAGGGDVDGDGVLDVAIGKRTDTTGGPTAGIFAMISGATGAVLRTVTGGPCDGFGAVLALADVNGDGHADVVAGRRNDLNHADDVRVTSGLAPGAAPGPAFTSIGLLPDAAQLDVAGDVNGDGYVDIIVGADEYGPNAGAVGIIAGGPWLGGAADGTLGVAMNQPTDVVTAAGSTGGDVRRVDRGLGKLTTVAVAQPPTMATPAQFALFGALYLPLETDDHPLPGSMGTMCIPAAPVSTAPLLFTLASSFPAANIPGGQVFQATSTPFAVTFAIPVPVTFVIQGVVEESPLDFKSTNGVIIDVR